MILFLKSKLLKDTAYYTIVNILDKAIPFLIMPIIARILTKEDMGCYSLYQATFQILIPILTFCIEYPIIINFFKKDKEEFQKYFTTGILLTCLIWTGMVLISMPFLTELSSLFGLSLQWLIVTAIIVLLNFINQLRISLYQQQRRPLSYGLFSIPLMLIKNILALYFILVLDIGWEGLILGHLIGHSLFVIISVSLFFREKLIAYHFESSYLYGMLKVGVPVGIHTMSGWFCNSLNRVIINFILGTAATGSYGIGATFGVIVTVLGDAVNKAFAPYLFGLLSKSGTLVRNKINKMLYIYYAGFIALGIGMSLVGYLGIGFIFGEKYSDTRFFIIPIIASATINGLYKLHVNFIFFAEKTYIIAKNTLFCGLANIPIAYVFTKSMGLLGSAYSAVVIQLLLYTLTVYHARKLHYT